MNEKEIWLEEAKELLRDRKYAQLRTIMQEERAADIAEALQDLPQTRRFHRQNKKYSPSCLSSRHDWGM